MLFPRLRDPFASGKRLQARAAFLLAAQGRLILDGWCPSLSDLRLGIGTIARLAEAGSIPVLAANLTQDAGPAPFPAHRIVERAGIRIGLFGLVGARAGAGPPEGFALGDPVEAAQRQIEALGPRVDLIICLSNLGLEGDRHLAERVPGIHAIIGAGDDRMILMPRRVGDSLILQAYKKGEYLGLLEFRLADQLLPLLDEHQRARLQRERDKMAPADGRVQEIDRQLAAFVGRSTFKAVLRPLAEDIPEDQVMLDGIRAQLAAEKNMDDTGAKR